MVLYIINYFILNIEEEKLLLEQNKIIKKMQKRVSVTAKHLQEYNRNNIQQRNEYEENISNIERELNTANNKEKKTLDKNLSQISKLNDAFE